MSNFLMGLFLVQLLLGAYQFSYTVDAGRPESNARATRLEPPVVYSHLALGAFSAMLWVGWLTYADRAFAWATFVVLAVGAAMGLTMLARTVVPSVEVGGPSADPADHRVAEKRIPAISLALHGLMATMLLVLVLLVAVGVFD